MAINSSLLLPFLLSLLALVSAHGDEDHATMPGMGDDSSESMGMMKMWFHFSLGDTLLFETWTPTSAGAVVAACVVLLDLGIVDRAFNAVRAAAEAKWSLQAQPHLNPSSSTYSVSTSGESMPTIPLKNPKNSENETLSVSPRMRDFLPGRGPPAAWVQPRRLGRDAMRAGLQAVQSGLGLLLMLAVMLVVFARQKNDESEADLTSFLRSPSQELQRLVFHQCRRWARYRGVFLGKVRCLPQQTRISSGVSLLDLVAFLTAVSLRRVVPFVPSRFLARSSFLFLTSDNNTPVLTLIARSLLSHF